MAKIDETGGQTMKYVIDICKYGTVMSESGYLIEEDTQHFDTLDEAVKAFEGMVKSEDGHDDYSYQYQASLWDGTTGKCLRSGWFDCY
jgi:hypothetical protein